MRGLCRIERCCQFSQVPWSMVSPGNNLFQRHASRQSSPGFSASKPPTAKARPPKQQSPTFDERKSSEKTARHSGEYTTKNASKKFRIGPLKIILLSSCVYIGYRVYKWQSNPHRSLILNPQFFNPFILVKRERVSSTSCINYLLSVPKGQNTENVAEAWRTGVWSVQVMQPELQIARSYTPLPPHGDSEPQELRLFVRKEPQGEVSTFLHKIYRGTIVHLRGPRVEYEIPQDIDEVLFIAGGTGIAPALQVAHILLNYRTSLNGNAPKLRILWANRRREDSYKGLDQSQEGLISKLRDLTDAWIRKPNTEPKGSSDRDAASLAPRQTVLVEEIEALRARHADQVHVDYFVDEDDSYITERVLRNYLTVHDEVSEQIIEDRPVHRKVILISGPEGFVNQYAGAKIMAKGKEVQGPLGGLLQRIGPKGWEIWKL